MRIQRVFLCGSGNDGIKCTGGNDQLIGGEGNDLLSSYDEDDSLRGDGGSDVLTGASRADVLSGGDGDEILVGEGYSTGSLILTLDNLSSLGGSFEHYQYLCGSPQPSNGNDVFNVLRDNVMPEPQGQAKGLMPPLRWFAVYIESSSFLSHRNVNRWFKPFSLTDSPGALAMKGYSSYSSIISKR